MHRPIQPAPARGSFGAMRGCEVDIGLAAWHTHQGEPYLNDDRGGRREWLRDSPGNIDRAEALRPLLAES